MFDTESRINAKNVDYSVDPDEFVLPQSALTNEYFADLESLSNPYTHYTNYETATPSISVTYPNDPVPLEEQYRGHSETQNVNTECISKVVKIIGNVGQIWKRIFPDSAKEMVFLDTEECTFKPFESILSAVLGKSFDLKEVKRYLWTAYSKHFEKTPENLLKICSIMRKQGKSKMFERAVKQRDAFTPAAFEAIIMSDSSISWRSRYCSCFSSRSCQSERRRIDDNEKSRHLLGSYARGTYRSCRRKRRCEIRKSII
jgi:hypothetical protein